MDAEILGSIRGRGLAKKGVDLVTILDDVDFHQRILLSFDELAGGLRRLAAAGRIEEAAPGRYRPTVDHVGSRVIDLDRATYERAVELVSDFASDVTVAGRLSGTRAGACVKCRQASPSH